MKFYLISGERSGDQHGAKIINHLKEKGSCQFRGIGGNNMQAAGMELFMHSRSLSIMGWWEVIKSLRRLRRYREECLRDIFFFHPDIIILIDSGGFNLPIAKAVKNKGYKVCYFIPPKVWAWGSWRIGDLRRYVDLNLVLFPFEEKFYRENHLPVFYAGYPLTIPMVEDQKRTMVGSKGIALLPGSRLQEIKSTLAVMLEVATLFPNEKFMICGVDEVSLNTYNNYHLPTNVSLVFDRTYQVLSQSKAAIVVSGTATFEACLYKVPQIVVYKTGALNYLLARALVKVKYISLVNLIMDKEVVTELIQSNCTAGKIQKELHQILNSKGHRKTIFQQYDEVISKIKKGNTYEELANRIEGMLS